VSADGSQVSREVYFSDDIFEVERANIFQRCWLYVGHESQVPAPGDYITSWMGEEPVILVRGTDHALQVLVNSCSHRGTRICRAHAGTATSFTCPYHGWQFGTDGDLRGVPHLSAYGGTLDKSAWGLHRAASVDSVFGLVFATFDPEAAPLASFLGGDLVGYLETVFQRDDAGIRVLGGMHRWKLDCNWKVPVENHAPDMIHVDPSHRSAFAALGTDEFTLTGSQITTAEGHMFAARYLEADAGVDERLPGHGMANFPAAGPFLRSRQPAAERRLGPVRSRLAPIAATVFPNLSVVPTNFTIRINHPRGPGVTEMWSWCFAPADASDDVVHDILTVYETMLGPAGFLEAEDGENWTSMSRGAQAARTDPRPFNLTMGLGDDVEHPDLPGRFGAMWSEHNQRTFYRTWRRWAVGR
jgi:phenylpropionate dioxygenase-like ring-hydroxylating dioxygenase large terminal subunit